MEETDIVELLAGALSMARMTHEFFTGLIEQGFTEAQALKLTGNCVHALWGGRASSD